MSRFEAWFLHVATLLVGGTGLILGVMRYFMEPVDEFAIVNHPWEPHLLHLHVLFAPALVFAIGLVWKRHVGDRWSVRQLARRRSGRTLAVLFGAMVLSGYLIQVVVAPGLRVACIVVHVAASLAWLLAYAGHLLAPRRSSSQAPATVSGRAEDVERRLAGAPVMVARSAQRG